MTERERRVVTMGGGIVLAAVLTLRVLPWIIRSAQAAEMGLQDRAEQLARARVDLAQSSELRDSAARLGQALVGLAPKILSGNSALEAIADLSGRVNLAATRHRATLERIDPVPDSAHASRLRRVTLRATLECDIRGLVGVLKALAFEQVALGVQGLRVTAMNPGSAETNPEVLRVEMTVAGWFLAGGEPPGRRPETGGHEGS